MTETKHPLQGALDRLGLSQKKLAKVSGVPQSVICQTCNLSGGRVKFSPDAAKKMLPHLRGADGKLAITYEELTQPPGEGAALLDLARDVAPAAGRRRKGKKR